MSEVLESARQPRGALQRQLPEHSPDAAEAAARDGADRKLGEVRRDVGLRLRGGGRVGRRGRRVVVGRQSPWTSRLRSPGGAGRTMSICWSWRAAEAYATVAATSASAKASLKDCMAEGVCVCWG